MSRRAPNDIGHFYLDRVLERGELKLPFGTLLRPWQDLLRFYALGWEARSIVFYAEDGGSWVHFEGMIRQLTGKLRRQICYITSSPNDPVLNSRNEQIRPFYLGFGTARTVLFRTLNAGVMVMTMPDLGSFHIKRSQLPVQYVYVHHSMVSTHMIYRPAAFDQFDVIMCVGPHHEEEIRAREELLGLKPKTLIDHGYQRLDSILDSVAVKSRPAARGAGLAKQVLVAPTWGEDALLETCGPALMEVLLAAGHRVIVRPHPMTLKRSPKVIASLTRRHNSNPSVSFDFNISSEDSLAASDIMISDWSGAAFEYAFGFERPVLFVDVPRKVNNREYEKLPVPPIEVQLRDQLGAVVSPLALGDIPQTIEELCADPQEFLDRLRSLRERWVYNVGSSGSVGAEHIAKLADGSDYGLNQT